MIRELLIVVFKVSVWHCGHVNVGLSVMDQKQKTYILFVYLYGDVFNIIFVVDTLLMYEW